MGIGGIDPFRPGATTRLVDSLMTEVTSSATAEALWSRAEGVAVEDAFVPYSAMTAPPMMDAEVVVEEAVVAEKVETAAPESVVIPFFASLPTDEPSSTIPTSPAPPPSPLREPLSVRGGGAGSSGTGGYLDSLSAYTTFVNEMSNRPSPVPVTYLDAITAGALATASSSSSPSSPSAKASQTSYSTQLNGADTSFKGLSGSSLYAAREMDKARGWSWAPTLDERATANAAMTANSDDDDTPPTSVYGGGRACVRTIWPSFIVPRHLYLGSGPLTTTTMMMTVAPMNDGNK